MKPSIETVMGMIAVCGMAFIWFFLWNMDRTEEKTGIAISEQIKENKEECLFGWDAFCVKGALYIRDPETGYFSAAHIEKSIFSTSPIPCVLRNGR